MNRQTFLHELSSQLKHIPNHERNDILSDFKEHYKSGLENGKSEEQISNDLGHPKVIARELLAEYRISQAESDQSVRSIFQAVVATISLSFFNMIFLLGPIVAVIAVYIALSGMALAFTLSPIAWIVSLFFNGLSHFLAEFFAILSLSSLGVLMSIGMMYVGKFLYHAILKYVKFNIRIVKGREAK
ncbi:HAAS signaling domain-containing protein [Bacillus weihaiensis]|uniref:HAAS signaling domain-containing protein n=1 Tax=Bacillus weihaiensis TaxID=1547283 RepID=UPI00235666CB|nr:DUF1700 domain-containing protein [Bacillus weihaiensis]